MNRNYVVLGGGAIALLAGIVPALVGAGKSPDSALAIQQSSAMMLPTAPISSAPSPTQNLPSPPPPPLTVAAPNVPSLPTIAIASCNGVPASANFRFVPSASPSVILKSLPPGSVVTLMGNIADGDGLRWYQVQFEGQVGWISACFVE